MAAAAVFMAEARIVVCLKISRELLNRSRRSSQYKHRSGLVMPVRALAVEEDDGNMDKEIMRAGKTGA
jgi:hypothetical protein